MTTVLCEKKRPVNINRVEAEPAGSRVLWISLSNWD